MTYTSDPIGDTLSRLRNASAVHKATVDVPYSRLKFELLKVLEREGWLMAVERLDEGYGLIRITLKYDEQGKAALQSLVRISKPGRRVYTGRRELPRVKNDLGSAVISTSQGLMTNREARRRRLGGEILCEIA